MTGADCTELPILYPDEHLVANDKPAGMLVHRSPISRDRIFLLKTLRDGSGRHNRFFRTPYGLARLLLMAERLRLEHPVSGRPLCLQATPDHAWQSALRLFAEYGQT